MHLSSRVQSWMNEGWTSGWFNWQLSREGYSYVDIFCISYLVNQRSSDMMEFHWRVAIKLGCINGLLINVFISELLIHLILFPLSSIVWCKLTELLAAVSEKRCYITPINFTLTRLSKFFYFKA